MIRSESKLYADIDAAVPKADMPESDRVEIVTIPSWSSYLRVVTTFHTLGAENSESSYAYINATGK